VWKVCEFEATINNQRIVYYMWWQINQLSFKNNLAVSNKKQKVQLIKLIFELKNLMFYYLFVNFFMCVSAPAKHTILFSVF
jgi:hypothetical protein